MSINENNLFKQNYNKANKINLNENLDINDEVGFLYMDILRNKEVEVEVLQSEVCICLDPKNIHLYYEKCDKCEEKGFLNLFDNQVICNKCRGEKRTTIHKCGICSNKGYYLTKKLIKVQLNNRLIEGDFIKIEKKGLAKNNKSGDLYLKVNIKDKERYYIKGLDIYDKAIIEFDEEDIKKQKSKQVETPFGFLKVFPQDDSEIEVVMLVNAGLTLDNNKGNYYVSIKKQLTPIKGQDRYSNIILIPDSKSFYLSNKELYENKKLLTAYYFKPLNDDNYTFVTIENISSYKIFKIPSLGKQGKYNGLNGDLYLKTFIGDSYFFKNDVLYDLSLEFSKNEIINGRKTVVIGNEKIVFNYQKDLNEVSFIDVGNYGLINNDKTHSSLKTRLNPFDYQVYFVSLEIDKLDKIVYIDDYKYFFNEKVKMYSNKNNLKKYLKIDLKRFSKKNVNKAKDSEGNIIVFNLIEKKVSVKHGVN